MIPHNSVTGSRTDSVFSAVSTASRVDVLFLVLVISLWAGSLFAQSFQSASIQEEVEGELEILHEDRDVGSRYLYFLKAANRRFSLNFAKDPPTHLTSGAKVRARGVRTNNLLALQSGSESIQTVAAASTNTFSEQSTLVLLINFQDKPGEQPWTVEQIRDLVFNTTSNFFLENSYQQTWLSGDVAGWYTIPFTSTVCDIFSIASYAKSAASAAGFYLAAYQHYVYDFPHKACGG